MHVDVVAHCVLQSRY